MHPRTAFGVSSSFYTSEGQPFQGAVQGNGAATALWLIITIFLIRCLYQQKVVTSFTSPISKLSQLLAALMYVDDTEFYVFNDGTMDASTVVSKAQNLLNAWHEALKFTGGELKLPKCYWTLQDYHWHNSRCTSSCSTTSTICINSNNVPKVINHVPSDKMRILVGVPIVPSNDSAAIVSHYQDKIIEYVTRLKGTNLNPQDVFFGYEKYWIPALEFASPVLTMPHNGMLLAPLHKAILPKLKIMRTFPLVMREAPVAIGGLDLHSIEITCGVKAIHHLVSLFTSYTPSKLLLSTAIEHQQLEIGVGELFLNSSYFLLSSLATSTWITHLWEFLQIYKLEICLPTLVLPSTPCSNDVALIDLLISSGWKVNRLRLANQTRL